MGQLVLRGPTCAKKNISQPIAPAVWTGCFRVVYVKFWPQQCCRRNRDSSDESTFSHLLMSQPMWICSLGFLLLDHLLHLMFCKFRDAILNTKSETSHYLSLPDSSKQSGHSPLTPRKTFHPGNHCSLNLFFCRPFSVNPIDCCVYETPSRSAVPKMLTRVYLAAPTT